MNEFIFLFSPTNKTALGAIRNRPGLQAAEDENAVYLRGKRSDETVIQSLPAIQRYLLDEKEFLFPVSSLTPVGKLPQLNWQSLPDFLPVEMPVAALPGKLPTKEKVQLIPAEETQEGFALMTDLQQWKTWAETASAVRLQALQFAVSSNNEVLITGKPLPPLPGKEYWMKDGVLIPAGYAFEFAMLPEIIATELNRDKDSLLLLDTDANWQTIPLNAFVPASRSAIRLTDFVK